jgi:hypothetical protein
VRGAVELCGLDRRVTEFCGVAQPSERLEWVALDEHHRYERPGAVAPAHDVDHSVYVGEGRVVALEIVLGPAEVI